jgi:hypothetical protein
MGALTDKKIFALHMSVKRVKSAHYQRPISLGRRW